MIRVLRTSGAEALSMVSSFAEARCSGRFSGWSADAHALHGVHGRHGVLTSTFRIDADFDATVGAVHTVFSWPAFQRSSCWRPLSGVWIASSEGHLTIRPPDNLHPTQEEP